MTRDEFEAIQDRVQAMPHDSDAFRLLRRVRELTGCLQSIREATHLNESVGVRVKDYRSAEHVRQRFDRIHRIASSAQRGEDWRAAKKECSDLEMATYERWEREQREAGKRSIAS
jgi:hypothetical protein